MLSKNFYVQLIFRVVAITAIALIFAFSCSVFNWFFMIPSVVLLTLQVLWLIRFLNRNNRRMAYFFESIKNEDYSLQFPEDESLESLNELHKGLNKVNHLIRETQIKNKAQEKYYQEILKEASIGILTFNQKGHVLFSNPTAKKLLNHEHLSHIKQIEMIHKELYAIVKSIQPFERKLFEFSNERESRQLVIKCSEIVLNDESLLLIVIQDIKNELDDKETDSWIKLIRVLTHEIMNTIAPITSISESLLKHYRKENSLNEDQIVMTTKGLQVIQEQSKNLTAFVQSYRRLLNVSKPDKEIIDVAILFDKVKALMEEEFHKNNIEFIIQSNSDALEIFADEKQITQVLLNLLKNAMQALSNIDSATITLESGIYPSGEKYIAVCDNGPGISKDKLDQIFIPFFTTKSNGTGIGLSLSKQILSLHEGSLSVRTQPNVETVFTLKF
jgi:nitrogen fixation/metabolism regulation signal transduction histidine kinase